MSYKDYTGYTIDAKYGLFLDVVEQLPMAKAAKHDAGICYRLVNQEDGKDHCARWSQESIEASDKAGDVFMDVKDDEPLFGVSTVEKNPINGELDRDFMPQSRGARKAAR